MNRRNFLRISAVYGAGVLLGSKSVLAAPVQRFRLGVITDELSNDPERAIALMRDFRLNWVELREVWGKHVILTDAQERRELRDLLSKYGVFVANIAAPTFKTTFPGTTPLHMESTAHVYKMDPWEVLERAVETARFFNVPRVRAFTFWRVADDDRRKLMPEIVEVLKKATRYAERNGVSLVIENEYSTNVATGSEVGDFIQQFDSPFIGILWDPGNAFFGGERDWQEGYKRMPKGRIYHVHLKDAIYDKERQRYRWVAVGAGEIGYVGLFRTLFRDKYRGTLSLETHYKTPSKEMASIESMRGILKCIREA